MRRLKRVCLFLLVVFILFFTACADQNVPVSDTPASVTLPPAKVDFIAPIGDAALEYTADTTLYLPRYDQTGLIALTAPVAFSEARPKAESIARALLSHPGDGVASALGGEVKLSLYGVNPVEQSRDVVTVNLAASALQLNRQAFYIACQAIANTMTELNDVNYVNILVMDKPLGLDIANSLPMGAFSKSVAQNIGAAYEQLLSRRVQASESATSKHLSSNAVLYFPVSGTPGIVSEARTCSFGTQVFSDMVVTLLRELAAGPAQAIDSPTLPLLGELLLKPPAVTYDEPSGGDVITLSFDYNLDDMLEGYGITRAQSMASICYTLCTFFPNAVGLRVTIGEAPVDTLMLTEAILDSVTFEDGVMRRADFAPLLYDYCTLSFAEDQKLKTIQRPTPYYRAHSPRYLLMELAKGPLAFDGAETLNAVMPRGAITDADILGLALSGDTLLVNLAPSLSALGVGMSEGQERILAYAMVNTLLAASRANSVCFFISGSQFDGYGGGLYWRGLFYPLM